MTAFHRPDPRRKAELAEETKAATNKALEAGEPFVVLGEGADSKDVTDTIAVRDAKAAATRCELCGVDPKVPTPDGKFDCQCQRRLTPYGEKVNREYKANAAAKAKK